MPGPGLYVAMLVLGVVFIVVSRRHLLAEDPGPHGDPGEADGHADDRNGSHEYGIGRVGWSDHLRYEKWTDG